MAEIQLDSSPANSSSIASAGGSKLSHLENAASGNSQSKTTSASTGNRKSKGSSFNHDYGKRNIKSYPITDAELGELFGISVVAAICFSVATGLFGFAVNLSKDLSFNPTLSKEIRDKWEHILSGCIILTVLLFIVGIVVFFFGRNKISKIKTETEFQK